MKNLTVLASLSLTLVFGACKSPDGSSPSNEEERTESVISAEDIPAAVTAAALEASPGLVISGAEVEGDGIYCVRGMDGLIFTEVKVDSKTGKVLGMGIGYCEEPDAENDDDGGSE